MAQTPVATVKGHPITTATYDHWLVVTAASRKTTPSSTSAIPDPPKYTACIARVRAASRLPKGQTPVTETQLKSQCEREYISLQQEALGALIEDQWTLDEAAKLGVTVARQQVEKESGEIEKHDYPSAEMLRGSGQSAADITWRTEVKQLKNAMTQKVVAAAHIEVSEAQVNEYFEKYDSYFEQPEKLSVSMIRAKTLAQAYAAKREIESGKRFASVAKKRSIEPMSEYSKQVSQGMDKAEAKPIATAVFTAGLHTLVGPLKREAGYVPTSHGNEIISWYYLFEVNRVINRGLSVAQIKSDIRRKILAEGRSAAILKFNDEFAEKRQAETDCDAGYVVEECMQYQTAKVESTGNP